VSQSVIDPTMNEAERDSSVAESDAPLSETRQPAWRVALHWTVVAAILGGLFWLALRTIDFQRFWAALAHARWGYIALAPAGALICVAACSVRLWLLTTPLPQPPGKPPMRVSEMTSIYFASSAAHHLLPAPAAEILRTVQLKRLWGYSIAGLIASQLVERIIDSLSLGLDVIGVSLVGSLPQSLHAALWTFGALTLFAPVGLLFVAYRFRHITPRGRVTAFLHRLGEGTALLHDARRWLLALLFSGFNDALNAATLGLCAAGVGVSLSPSGWYLGILAARMAGLLPSTPGQFGVVEAAMTLTLGFFGVDPSRAFAVAVLYHLAHFTPITLVGLWELKKQWRR
jgi:uncharacterized membrane protein YbhN (UPF0104 family)